MELKSVIQSYLQEMSNNLIKLINIRSVEGVPLRGKPFGEEVDRALQFMLGLSRSLGLATTNLNGYIGYAEYGNGDEIIGILVHLDVVPEGDGWTYPPYEGILEDGKIFGRGAIDDKGPAIAVLYAIKALIDLGWQPNKKIRLIFGTNEETSWKDIDHYLKHDVVPDLSFTPDGDFPLVFAEKGMIGIQLEKNAIRNSGLLISIKGGTAINMVPSYCKAVLDYKIEENENFIDLFSSFPPDYCQGITGYKDEENHYVVESTGSSAHGSIPEEGINAISRMIIFLSSVLDNTEPIYETLSNLSHKIARDCNGSALGCDFTDLSFNTGRFTSNIGIIEYDGNCFKIIIDMRYPFTQKKDSIIECIDELANKTKMKYEILKDHKPLFVDPKSRLIEVLLGAYKKATGNLTAKPISISGATYARAFKNTVAFGPLFPKEQDTAHKANEYISVENLSEITRIYSQALLELSLGDIPAQFAKLSD
jgi:succinyl-diaminopimelate desuccinylase